ncbi:hypothetical protein NLI96_g3131 [Meripilus lineatus]|uniref:DUF6533 domain-containing protein n=1 Tax=Meripilus lineatus TaxID=2056292 RepID=A0AAD5V7H8_9APHY|nr:hypothetical protein NLI96_g3131 [Physisporinus lineatus]
MLVRPFSGEIETCVTDELMNSSLHLNLDGPQRAMVQSRLNTARNELEPSIRGHVRNFLSWVGNQSLNGNHVDCPCVIRLALWTLKFHSICLMVAPLSRLPISRRGNIAACWGNVVVWLCTIAIEAIDQVHYQHVTAPIVSDNTSMNPSFLSMILATGLEHEVSPAASEKYKATLFCANLGYMRGVFLFLSAGGIQRRGDASSIEPPRLEYLLPSSPFLTSASSSPRIPTMADTDFTTDQLYLANYTLFLAGALFFYDYFITLDQEVQYVWFAFKGGGVWLFLLNRYFTFITYLTGFVPNFTPFSNVESCRNFSFYREVTLIASMIVSGVILVLRTYALYRRNNKILALMLSVAVVLIGISGWSITGQQSNINIVDGCHWGLLQDTFVFIVPIVVATPSKTDIPFESRGVRTAIAWEALLTFDVMIFTLTIAKTIRDRRDGRIKMNALVELIARDGENFSLMACANAANATTFYVLAPPLKGTLSSFAINVSSTMVSRMMLNIRQRAHIPTPYSFSLGSAAESTSVDFTSGGVTENDIQDDEVQLDTMGGARLEEA